MNFWQETEQCKCIWLWSLEGSNSYQLSFKLLHQIVTSLSCGCQLVWGLCVHLIGTILHFVKANVLAKHLRDNGASLPSTVDSPTPLPLPQSGPWRDSHPPWGHQGHSVSLRVSLSQPFIFTAFDELNFRSVFHFTLPFDVEACYLPSESLDKRHLLCLRFF